MVRIWQPLATISALSFASPLKKRVPQTGKCTGTCQGKLHDPAVVYREETEIYCRFTTNNKINTATAPHISGPWTDQGAVMPEGSSIELPGRMDLWAPDVFNVNGAYHMYYSVSAMGSQNSDIGVATSTTMDPGSWVDQGSIGIPQSNSYNKIDANLFQHSAESPFLLNFWLILGSALPGPVGKSTVKSRRGSPPSGKE